MSVLFQPNELRRLLEVAETSPAQGLVVEIAGQLVATKAWDAEQSRRFVESLSVRARAFFYHYFLEGAAHYANLRAALDYVMTADELAAVIELREWWWRQALDPAQSQAD